MSTTDDARLDAIDRRGRAAARTLRDDLAARGTGTDTATLTLIADRVPAKAIDPATWDGAGTTVPGATEVHLDRSRVRKSGRPPRRARLVAAVAVAVLGAVAGAAAVASRDDGGADVSSAGALDFLLPGWLPAGFEPAQAIDVPGPAGLGYRTDVAVYGDPDADDPWAAAPVAVVHLVADEELLGDSSSGDGGERVEVNGQDATLRRSEGIGPTGPVWEVERRVDDGRLIVSGDVDRDEILAAAEAASTEPAIAASGLPDGYEELAHGPFTDLLLFTSLFEGNLGELVQGSVDEAGLAVTYADPSDRGAVRRAIVVAQRPGPASAVDLLRMSLGDADDATVRGRHAVIGRDMELPGSAGEGGVVAVQWAETEGQLVTVVGYGVTEDEVLQVAEQLRSASSAEIAALRDQDPPAASREFDEVTAGQVVAASGESRTGRWRIVANTRREANIGALTIDRLWGTIGSTTSTTGDRHEPPLDLQIDVSDGTVVAWGVLYEDAVSVTVEAEGADPITLGIHEVDGWDHPVVAGSFAVDHFAPDAEITVVARDADGREVARNDTALDLNG